MTIPVESTQPVSVRSGGNGPSFLPEDACLPSPAVYSRRGTSAGASRWLRLRVSAAASRAMSSSGSSVSERHVTRNVR